MNITREEARASLSTIDQTEGRSRTLRAYGGAGSIIMLWGTIWVLGYGAMGVLPGENWGWVWLPLDALGIIGTLMLTRRSGAKGPGVWWKGLIAAVGIAAVVTAIVNIMPPSRPEAVMALPPLLVGFAYILLGLHKLTRFIVVGVALIAATIAGYVWLLPWFALWMAAVGGLGLLVGGWWMRQA